MTILLDNVAVDTTSAVFDSKGGIAVVNIRGTDFGGGTVTIETASANDSLSRFLTLTDGSFTANASVKLDYLPLGTEVRAVLTGSTGADDVFVDILQ